ncbi:MAG: diacylglycerol kinase [Cypionkella sp.]|uniref:diacylglycerol kinase n=1 Tax=Cypionkella sp. TaxID=2811411 RepID=UPI002620BF7E|nr:diacylglycerol kinase [Cypionkella sp.]MDB5659156.1 diacylglycerol kinase [Cypionkella sp.]
MRDILNAEARRFANTVIWSWAGWTAAWATEKTLRQWTAVNVLSAALAFLLDLSAAERGMILALGLLVLAAELMNTGLEEVVDYISKADDPRAKKAKDCGSAAVALTAIAGGVAWVVVLIG